MLPAAAMGARIRALRRSRRLTLADLAAASGVSRSMISEIERGGRAPTVLVLDRVATALGSSIARLTQDESGYEPVLLTRDAQAVLADPAGWERRILSPVLPGVEFEFMRTTLGGLVDAGTYLPHAPGSREYVAVEQGTLELTLDGAASRLAEGDSIFYPGDCRHGFANPAAERCVYYLAMDVAGEHRPAGFPPGRGCSGGGCSSPQQAGSGEGRVTAERAAVTTDYSAGASPDEPGWAWSRAQLCDLAEGTAELMADLLAAGRAPVTRRPPRELLEMWAAERWDEAGVPVEQVLAEFAATVAPYPFGNAHPRFAAWVNSPPHPLGVAASALAAAMNPSVAGGNHAAVHLERQVVRWFADLLGWAGGHAGQLVSGGSAATLTALAAARRRAMTRAGLDDRRDGVSAAAGVPVVYATAEAHSCATKAVEILGIGSAHITVIATGADRAMDPADLQHRVTADRAAGKLAIAVVASAGTVNTGAVDPLPDIAAVCARHDVWLHVDGAYGAPAVLLLDSWETVRAGLARADSIALDPHKWLYAPVDAGLILFRDEAIARDTFSLVPPYLRTGGDADEPVWFSEYGLEQTRPFRSLKIWMQLKHLGQDGYRLIARDIAVADALRRELDRAADFQVLGHGLSVVCFRHLGTVAGEPGLDAHNEALLHTLQASGRAFLAGTRVDGRFALRACIVNPATTTADTRAIIAEIRRCAAGPPSG